MSKEMNFSLNFDTKTRIMHEKIEGQFTTEYYLDEYHASYVALEKELKTKPWAKLIDMRAYIPSNIAEALKVHATWLRENGCKHIVCVIPESSTTKMQMGRASRENDIDTYLTTSFEDGTKWLKVNGF